MNKVPSEPPPWIKMPRSGINGVPSEPPHWVKTLSVRIIGLKQEGGELFVKDFRKY